MVDDLSGEPAGARARARPLLTTVAGLANRIAVQLFRRLPWLGDVWAARRAFVEERGIPWAALRRPLARCRVSLVTTAGVHVVGDTPFDMSDKDGDPSFRVIPADSPSEDLTITHDYYDHRAADQDVNVVLPIDRLHDARAAGRISDLGPRMYSFMGHVDGPHVRTLLHATAPQVARRLVEDGADAVLMTPA
jgi:D-proline reductase (dithiol) PrdB